MSAEQQEFDTLERAIEKPVPPELGQLEVDASRYKKLNALRDLFFRFPDTDR